jgi:hypothetical protein
MAKSRGRKYYEGDIHFDFNGNMLRHTRSSYYGKYNIPKDDIRGSGKDITVKWNDKWHDLTGFDFDIEAFAPKQLNSWDSKFYVATLSNGPRKPNYRFKDELKIIGYGRGRSSTYMRFKSTTDQKEYYVFANDFVSYFVDKMVHGKLQAEFTFCKRGGMQGLTIVEEKAEIVEESGD